MAKMGKTDQIRVVKGDSLLSLSSLVAAGRSSSFDVIYVDASHKVMTKLIKPAKYARQGDQTDAKYTIQGDQTDQLYNHRGCPC